MPTVRYTNEEARRLKGRVNRELLDKVTEEDIQRWKEEDGFGDDAVWGPPRWVSGGPDVAAIRTRLGLTQEDFARRFALAVRTVQEWEQRRRMPDGPALALLRVIDREPAAAARALAGEWERTVILGVVQENAATSALIDEMEAQADADADRARASPAPTHKKRRTP